MRHALILAAGLAASFLVAGCGGSSSSTGPGGATTGTHTTDLTVYFMRGEKIGAAHRVVSETKEVGAAAVRALLEGPTAAEREAGLGTEIPDGTQLLGLSIDGGVATVDLSGEFESGGGSLSMLARVAEVVYTLTQFPSVEKLRFELGGKAVQAIGREGIVVDSPVGRADYEDVTPAILVESPAVGDTVRSPLHARGTANTFEATFMVNIVDSEGKVIANTFETATSGSGQRGTFDVTVPFTLDRSGRGALIVFESSAADGSRIHIVKIPLELEK